VKPTNFNETFAKPTENQQVIHLYNINETFANSLVSLVCIIHLSLTASCFIIWEMFFIFGALFHSKPLQYEKVPFYFSILSRFFAFPCTKYFYMSFCGNFAQWIQGIHQPIQKR
jgi:hypothetical protein